jgi:hypothetical protein
MPFVGGCGGARQSPTLEQAIKIEAAIKPYKLFNAIRAHPEVQ